MSNIPGELLWQKRLEWTIQQNMLHLSRSSLLLSEPAYAHSNNQTTLQLAEGPTKEMCPTASNIHLGRDFLSILMESS